MKTFAWEAAFAGVVLASAAAACGSSDNLKGYDPYVGGPSSSPPPSSTPAANNQAATAVNPATGQSQPVPTSGPGSMDSPARQFFIASVFPALTICVTCHATGNQGAPKFMALDAPSSYAGIDARGLIQANSLFLTKGTHAAGLAPALDANQLKVVTDWLDLEGKERVGQAAPVNILEKIGDCLDEALFKAIEFEDLRTQPRENENTDRCTGCDNAPCRTCHTAGDGNFYMAIGSALDDQTFVETKTPRYIVKYLGLNGTVPTSSNAVALKGQATATDRPYSHPMFEISTEMQTRIDAFVNDAITKYQAKQCGQ